MPEPFASYGQVLILAGVDQDYNGKEGALAAVIDGFLRERR